MPETREPERTPLGKTWAMAVAEHDAQGAQDAREDTQSDVVRVARWLMSADGQAMVQRELRRCGLPESYDADLAAMIEHAARRMADRGQSIESIPAWTTHTCRRRAMDLLKSPAHQRRDPLDDSINESGLADGSDPIADLLAAMHLAGIRRHVGRVDRHPHVWPVSASLSFLSVAIDGCAPGRGCPAPIGGADEFDAAHWAALFYAGETACFATTGTADTATIRQRRKRRIDTVRAVLADAYEATQADGGSADD